jgi:putative transposase
MPLLTNNAWRIRLSRSIDDACQSVGGFLAAFVYMPEHVHLLIWGLKTKEDVSVLLARIKQPVSIHVRKDLEARQSRLLPRLTVRERPGKFVFRYWQEGPGFDRNLLQPKVVQASLDYMHLNPVQRGLCVKARDWRWSSARFYASEGMELDEALPTLTPLPAEFWSLA